MNCKRCCKEKLITQFRVRRVKSKYGKIYEYTDTHCIQCRREIKKHYRNSMPKPAKVTTDTSVPRSRTNSGRLRKTREERLWDNYRISLSDVHAMYISQEGRCAICNVFKDHYSVIGGLYIDHDHTTGKVRGLLCISCNSMLGLAKDSTDMLKTAIRYLDKSKGLT